MTNIINATPHAITLNDGTVFPPSGMVARVDMATVQVDSVGGFPTFRNTAGDVIGLPAVQDGTVFIVSAMVLSNSDRPDLIAPNTNDCVRNDKGHVVSVNGFVVR